MKRLALVLAFALALSFGVLFARGGVALANNNYDGCGSNTGGCNVPTFQPPAPYPCCGCHWNSYDNNYASGSSVHVATTPPLGDYSTGWYNADITAVQDSDSNGHPCHDTYLRVSEWERIIPNHVPVTMYVEMRMWLAFGPGCNTNLNWGWWANQDTPQTDWLAIYSPLMQTGWCGVHADTYNTNAVSPSVCVSGDPICNPSGPWPPDHPAYPYANF